MYAGKNLLKGMPKRQKDTLRHYDEIGLLKPASINENGYRVYSASQIIDFLYHLPRCKKQDAPLKKSETSRDSMTRNDSSAFQ